MRGSFNVLFPASRPWVRVWVQVLGSVNAEVMACHVDAIDKAIAALKWQASIKLPLFYSTVFNRKYK